ncbi:MAG TPA: hypothetical protein VF131_15800 [Blastocatellia bacterium]|nr:hypothetical protein [Blastocatellia bacterium]
MANDGQSVTELIKSGKVSQSDLQEMFTGAAAGLVTIQDWGVCYSSATGQLSEFATVVSNNAGNPITGIGMIAYSSNGSSMYCVQYTNDISSPSVATSIGTTLIQEKVGNQVLGVVYGWTQQGSFYQSQPMIIQAC